MKSTVSSREHAPPTVNVSLSSVKPRSAKPAPVRMRVTRLRSAKLPGPGASGGGGGGKLMCCAAAIIGTNIHGFSVRARQHTKLRRAPGLREERRLVNAAVGSTKNITPKREKRTS